MPAARGPATALVCVVAGALVGHWSSARLALDAQFPQNVSLISAQMSSSVGAHGTLAVGETQEILQEPPFKERVGETPEKLPGNVATCNCLPCSKPELPLPRSWIASLLVNATQPETGFLMSAVHVRGDEMFAWLVGILTAWGIAWLGRRFYQHPVPVSGGTMWEVNSEELDSLSAAPLLLPVGVQEFATPPRRMPAGTGELASPSPCAVRVQNMDNIVTQPGQTVVPAVSSQNCSHASFVQLSSQELLDMGVGASSPVAKSTHGARVGSSTVSATVRSGLLEVSPGVFVPRR